MIGWVDVMERREYANWAERRRQRRIAGRNRAKSCSSRYGCSTCHLLDQQGRCPNLRGLYNKPVQLDDGRTVIADDAYIRESILDPNAKIASGFEPNIMPNFKGQISEQKVIQLIAYIKSLSPTTPGVAAGRPAAAGGDSTSGRRSGSDGTTRSRRNAVRITQVMATIAHENPGNSGRARSIIST